MSAILFIVGLLVAVQPGDHLILVLFLWYAAWHVHDLEQKLRRRR